MHSWGPHAQSKRQLSKRGKSRNFTRSPTAGVCKSLRLPTSRSTQDRSWPSWGPPVAENLPCFACSLDSRLLQRAACYGTVNLFAKNPLTFPSSFRALHSSRGLPFWKMSRRRLKLVECLLLSVTNAL